MLNFNIIRLIFSSLGSIIPTISDANSILDPEKINVWK